MSEPQADSAGGAAERRAAQQPRPADAAQFDRRSLLKRGLLLGGGLLGGAVAVDQLAGTLAGSAPERRPRRLSRSAGGAAGRRAPNILVVIVDQMRAPPRWTGSQAPVSSWLPNLSRLSREAVNFTGHYTASNDCTPARAALITGLYTHQTGCMITGGSTLDPGFPTWGSMLRDHGYNTYWYGKWHLTHRDDHWNMLQDTSALERYGFSGGTYPSPDGAPGQGWRIDPFIVSQFNEWFAQEGDAKPWCTTVSLVNPHDIAWWYTWTDKVPAERSAPRLAQQMPLNFETPQLLVQRGKPRLQLSLQETAAQSFGEVPFQGERSSSAWLAMLDLYLKLQREVDRHVGVLLQTLASRPQVAQNTVVIFTSDHGEYAGSHGLRGKGAAAYEEGIRVPLMIKDPRGELTAARRLPRSQLTSSVDIAPLLLTIASGSEDWRRDPHYEHLAGRLDIAALLRDPAAPGRSHVLHATDEVVTEFALRPYDARAPAHVLALRSARAKLVTYCDWAAGSTAALHDGSDCELYDYSTRAGVLEVDNVAGRSALEQGMRSTLRHLYESELAGPLPRHLRRARERGMADYFATAARDATGAAAARLTHAQRKSHGEGAAKTGSGWSGL